METLIVYGSTYGYTRDCVLKLAKMLKGEVVLADVQMDRIPDLAVFDAVVIGGSVYMGQVQKKVKQFCEDNAGELMNKTLGLFLCCGLPENFEQNLKNSFPEPLLGKAGAKVCFGGELRTESMKFMHRAITNMMKKANKKAGKEGAKPMPESIWQLADAMNAQKKR
jgi:menaquinone-dependent protoporphyrinogen oxidase